MLSQHCAIQIDKMHSAWYWHSGVVGLLGGREETHREITISREYSNQ